MPPGSDFNVVQNLIAQGTPTGVTVSGSTVTISLAATVNSGDVVAIDYSGTAIKNLTGQSAATFTGQPVMVGTLPPPGPITCTPPGS